VRRQTYSQRLSSGFSYRRTAHFGDLPAEVLHQLEPSAGVRHVVGISTLKSAKSTRWESAAGSSGVEALVDARVNSTFIVNVFLTPSA